RTCGMANPVARRARADHRDVATVVARARFVVLCAGRGPSGNLEEMCREAPRRGRLEHVVLQDEVARVAPVVRDVTLGVVAEDIDRPGTARRIERRAALLALPGRLQEAIHLAAVYVGCGCRRVVSTATVVVMMIDIGTLARR